MLLPEGRVVHGITIDDHEPGELSSHNAKTAWRLLALPKTTSRLRYVLAIAIEILSR